MISQSAGATQVILYSSIFNIEAVKAPLAMDQEMFLANLTVSTSSLIILNVQYIFHKTNDELPRRQFIKGDALPGSSNNTRLVRPSYMWCYVRRI